MAVLHWLFCPEPLNHSRYAPQVRLGAMACIGAVVKHYCSAGGAPVTASEPHAASSGHGRPSNDDHAAAGELASSHRACTISACTISTCTPCFTNRAGRPHSSDPRVAEVVHATLTAAVVRKVLSAVLDLLSPTSHGGAMASVEVSRVAWGVVGALMNASLRLASVTVQQVRRVLALQVTCAALPPLVF